MELFIKTLNMYIFTDNQAPEEKVMINNAKLTKEQKKQEKLELRLELKAWNDLIRRAKLKGALIEE